MPFQISDGYGLVSADPSIGQHIYAFLCQADKVGMIIGFKGRTINNIKQSTGTFVEIRPPQPALNRPEPWFIITGFPHQVLAALQFMNNIIFNTQQRDQQRANISHSQAVPTMGEFPQIQAAAVKDWAPSEEQLDSDICEIQQYITQHQHQQNQELETSTAQQDREISYTGTFIDQQIDQIDDAKNNASETVTKMDMSDIAQEIFDTTIESVRSGMAPSVLYTATPGQIGVRHTNLSGLGISPNDARSFEYFCQQKTADVLSKPYDSDGQHYYANTN